MKTIFVVDDNDTNLLLAEEMLSAQYNVYTLEVRSFEMGAVDLITKPFSGAVLFEYVKTYFGLLS